MPKFQVKSEHLMGFTAEATQPGQEVVKILVKAPQVTSDDPNFHIWIQQIHNLFFSKINTISSKIERFLILLHMDDTADIYLNDFAEMMSVRVNRNVKAGEPVFANDITDVAGIKFPDITILPTDVVIYSFRFNWKFGLYFDFGREINLDEMSKELAELHKAVQFQNLLDATNSEIASNTAPVLVITEGKTDWQHLENAKTKLAVKTDFALDKIPDERGDAEILQMCKHYCRMDNGKIIIFVFDRDNLTTLKQLEQKTVAGKDFQDWGNNVYSFALPVPDHRKDYKNISIEFYYTDDEIRTKDSEGKRLFFDNELKKEILPGNEFKKLEITPVASLESVKKIEDQDVVKIVDGNGNQVALSKANFAQKVVIREPGFDNFEVKEFNKIFTVIDEIIAFANNPNKK